MNIINMFRSGRLRNISMNIESKKTSIYKIIKKGIDYQMEVSWKRIIHTKRY